MHTESAVTSKRLAPLAKFRGRHYLSDQCYSVDELHELLDLAQALKVIRRRRRLTPFLDGATLGMIFQEPSTRTRVSFEAGMTELGGHAQFLRPGEIHLPGRESIKDTSRVLSRLCDAVMARCHAYAVLDELASWAGVPVINGMCSDWNHPVQSMTDMLTISEHFGSFEGLKLAYIGLGLKDAMTASEAITCTRMGINVVVATPPESPSSEAVEAILEENCATSGASYAITDDPLEAVQDADLVYTCMWWWLEDEEERQAALRLYAPYQVNEELWKHTKPGAKFMHCLPGIRGQEMTDAIIDAPFSLVYDQAENRKHFQKALLLALIGIDEMPTDRDLQEIGRALLS